MMPYMVCDKSFAFAPEASHSVIESHGGPLSALGSHKEGMCDFSCSLSTLAP